MTNRYANHPGRNGFSRDQLILKLHDFFMAYGELPTTRDCDKGVGGLASTKAYTREFGSLGHALYEAGMSSEPSPERQKKDFSEPVHQIRSKTGIRGHL